VAWRGRYTKLGPRWARGSCHGRCGGRVCGLALVVRQWPGCRVGGGSDAGGDQGLRLIAGSKRGIPHSAIAVRSPPASWFRMPWTPSALSTASPRSGLARGRSSSTRAALHAGTPKRRSHVRRGGPRPGGPVRGRGLHRGDQPGPGRTGHRLPAGHGSRRPGRHRDLRSHLHLGHLRRDPGRPQDLRRRPRHLAELPKPPAGPLIAAVNSR
jgi:hypothetical protein